MRLLDLKNGVYGKIDDDDLAVIGGRTCYLGVNGYVYLSRWIDGASRPLTLHSEIMGVEPGMHIDHINGDKTDNRRCNLRVVTPQINQVNRKRLNKNNTSGIRGVVRTRSSRKNPWLAQITVNRQCIYLGVYPTQEDAAEARRQAEIHYFGEECPRG